MTADRRGRGFTLIELLVVIVVLGILAAIVMPKLSRSKNQAFRSSMSSDLKNLASAQEQYHVKNFTYSASLSDLAALTSSGVALTINEADATGWGATATHTGVPGGECGIYYGTAAPSSGVPATTPGVVACDF